MKDMMKSVRIFESLNTLAEKEGGLTYSSTSGQKAEALLDQSSFKQDMHISIVDDAQAISIRNNQQIANLIREGKLTVKNLRLFNRDSVKNSIVHFACADF